MKQKRNGTDASEAMYISPNELAQRWHCAVSSVHRIARRAGFTRVCLGHGRNGMVRYLALEVVEYERNRSI